MTDRTVHLGFEVGPGGAVEIPVLNLAVVGQTQRSGKTTTLEALVHRSGVRALTFVTKRGEGSFAGGRRVKPYFRDRADWQFVQSLLDATLQEKNKFLRSWIIKITRTTRTLRDVQQAVKLALKKATGINEGVYTQLEAYLDLIVPEIERADLAESLEIGPGLNVMDVSSYALPMQMLFIQSAIDWVNERESNTVVVIPEAWEMVPEGRGSPVKASAEALVRKGSAIGNHIWLDSQDMAGVSKVLLRGCTVWLIGVQREANEIKRNLSNIPASIKNPSAAAVATLERGQFYACWGTHATKTYVQPAWMDADEAQEIACGGVQVTKGPPKLAAMARQMTQEKIVNEREAAQLREENATLRRRVEELERFIDKPKVGDSVEVTKRRERVTIPGVAEIETATRDLPLNGDGEAIYQFVKGRLTKEAPALLRVLTIKPELEILVERRTVSANGDTTQGTLAQLILGGFFKDATRADRARDEMARRGVSAARPTVYKELDKLTTLGFLTKENDGYRAVPDTKVRIVEA